MPMFLRCCCCCYYCCYYYYYYYYYYYRLGLNPSSIWTGAMVNLRIV